MRVQSRIVAYGSGNRGVAGPSGTPFDIGTTTTPITSKTIANPGSGYEGITWGDSGSKMYVVNLSGNVNQYTVNTPYDITTLIDTPTSFDVSPEETSPQAVEFKPDGTRMYISGADYHITQYTLGTAWNVTTAGSPVDGNTEYTGWVTTGMHFHPDGNRIFMVFHTFTGTVYLNSQTLGTPWEITSIIADSTYVNISSDTGLATGVHLSDDGTLLHVSSDDFGEDFVLQYSLSTPFDETSLTLDFTYDSSVLDTDVKDVTFDNTGYIMYLYGHQNDTIYQIPLTG